MTKSYFELANNYNFKLFIIQIYFLKFKHWLKDYLPYASRISHLRYSHTSYVSLSQSVMFGCFNTASSVYFRFLVSFPCTHTDSHKLIIPTWSSVSLMWWTQGRIKWFLGKMMQQNADNKQEAKAVDHTFSLSVYLELKISLIEPTLFSSFFSH